jgi:hypothetical protein
MDADNIALLLHEKRKLAALALRAFLSDNPCNGIAAQALRELEEKFTANRKHAKKTKARAKARANAEDGDE